MSDPNGTGIPGVVPDLPNPMSLIGQSQVTIRLDALQRLQKLAEVSAEEIARLNRRIVELERGAPEQAAYQLGEAFDKAFIIVRFAVANLPPEQNPNWPHAELAWLAEHIETLPGEKGAQDLAITLRAFAVKAKKWVEAYAEGRQRQLLEEENLARNAGRELEGNLVRPPGMQAPDDDEVIEHLAVVGRVAEPPGSVRVVPVPNEALAPTPPRSGRGTLLIAALVGGTVVATLATVLSLLT